MDTTSPVVRIVRRLPASPDEVFDAWTDADSIAEWMRAGGIRSVVAELDPRVGGRFRIVMRTDRGDTEHTGEYVEVHRPRRLVFTWRSRTTRDRETLVTVELRPVGDETEIALIHERLPDEPSRKQHDDGWTAIVESLGAHLRRE
jgi:uncharacterized protein YndB with AHSA1/START domain